MRRYLTKPATRALTPTGGFLKGFFFSLNPYVGCAFGAAGGCPFCYVRMLPVANAIRSAAVPAGDDARLSSRDELAWGNWVIAKSNLPDLLERELLALERKDRLKSSTVFMSSATDPYQGIERQMHLTRRALEAFIRHPIRRLLVQTRSPMVERDIDLLRTLGDSVIVSMTLETDDDSVRRALTPTSPSVNRRLATCARLRKAGIFTQLAISPMMPNNPERLAEIAAACADRVIVDTYFDGDGSHGRRSRALGMGELYAKLGYGEWFHPGAERELLAALSARLGDDRVLFSRSGFTSV